jgi:hypothetical protein
VIKRILKEKKRKFKIAGLSGTSGGAICALLAWYGLLKNDKKLSIEKLDGFYTDNSASSLWDSILNEWILWAVDSGEKPDELWIIQINPETRKNEPVSVKEITDRRNELAGNISLNQEVYFIETVNKWVKAGYLDKD